MRKRIITVIIASTILTMLAACGKTAEETKVAETVEANEEESVAEPTPSPEEIIEEALSEGKAYYYALDGKKADLDKALEEFKKAAELDSADAYYYIGAVQYKEEKYDEAKLAYEKAIELGNSMAKLGLGQIYQRGYGVEKDYAKAKELYEAAVSEGCIEANAGLGDLYQTGYGVDADGSKAVEFFEKAATGNEPEWVTYAYGSLMYMYHGGYDGVEKNEEKIEEYSAKVCELCKGWEPDYYMWPGNLYYGDGEYDKAIEYYEIAGEEGCADGYKEIGGIYSNWFGNTAEFVDYPKAMEYYEKAADMGDGDAMFCIGTMYENALGVETDYTKAVEWLDKAANHDQVGALAELGFLYYQGIGVEKDIDKACKYFERGADLGGTVSMLNLGVMYYNGEGVEKDEQKAAEYFKKIMEIEPEDSNVYKNTKALYDSLVKAGRITE